MNATEIEYEIYSEEDYNDMLDDVHGDVEIAGITYSTSHALKMVDPIAHRVGFSDYQEYEYVWHCGLCQVQYEDEEEAEECCDDEEVAVCKVCGTEYDDEEEAEECCEDEEI